MICPFCKVDKPESDFGARPTLTKYERWCKRCECNRASIRKHGLTVQQKAEIAVTQGGCAICGRPDPGAKGWTVDHDHLCCPGEKSCAKCRRGVLCGWCNKMLAYASDRSETLRSAIAYLERHAAGTCSWHMPLACSPRICQNGVFASSTNGTDGTYEESLSPCGEILQLSNACESESKILPSVVRHG